MSPYEQKILLVELDNLRDLVRRRGRRSLVFLITEYTILQFPEPFLYPVGEPGVPRLHVARPQPAQLLFVYSC